MDQAGGERGQRYRRLGVPYHGSHGHHAHSRSSALLRSGVPRAQARGLHQVLRLQELAVTTNTSRHRRLSKMSRSVSSWSRRLYWVVLQRCSCGSSVGVYLECQWNCDNNSWVCEVISVCMCTQFKSSVFLLINRVRYMSSFWSQAPKLNKKGFKNKCKCSIRAGFERVQNVLLACRLTESALL